MIEEVIEKRQETIEVGGKQYPLWEIVRVGEELYLWEIGIFAGIDGKMIPATGLNDDWKRYGRLKEIADQCDGEAKRDLKEVDAPL